MDIPSSVKGIGYGAFDKCKNLKDIYYEGSKTKWREITSNVDYVLEPGNEPAVHYMISESQTDTTPEPRNTKFITEKKDVIYVVTSSSQNNPTAEYIGLTKKGKKKKTISIPEYISYKGVKYRVTSVASKCFKNNKKLTNVKISSSITKIGNSAFEGCTNLKTATIGKGLKTIGKNAFKNCKSLKKLTLKSTKLKSVGKTAIGKSDTSHIAYMNSLFEGCSNLTSLDLSGFDTSGATDISSMFKDCSSLTSLDISRFDINKVRRTTSMLAGCTNLQKLAVFANVKFDITLQADTDCNWYDPSGNICTTVKQGVNTPVTYIRRKTLKASNTVISDINAVYYTGIEIKPAIQIKWQKLKGVSGYDIYLSKKQNRGYKKVASVNAKTTLKTIKKLGKKKLKKGTYYYYVVAKKKVGKKTYKSKISYKLNIKKK